MNRCKTVGLLGAVAAFAAIVAACGGDSDDSDGSGASTGEIRTDKGLAVAAIGAGFDPRLQGDGENLAETDQGAPEPAGGIGADSVISDRDTRYSPYYAPALQEGGAGITVQGYGTASTDADSAIVEFYFYSNGGGGVEPVPAPDTSSRSSGGSAGSGSAGIAEDLPLEADAASAQQATPITEASLQPVIDALVAAGVPRENIEFIGQSYYDKFSSSATLRATVTNLDSLDAAVTAATNAAAGLGAIQLSNANVMYTVNDCTALEEAAMQAAVEDANERGTAFAQSLGVTRGGIVGASHYSYSPYGGNACAGVVGGPYPLASESFVAGSSRTVQIFTNISVTYAIQ
jgi:uncharacterized protein YggE